MKRFALLRVCIFLLLFAASARAAQVVLAEGPVNGRLYSRDLITNQAIVPVGGAVVVSGMNRIHLVVFQDGSSWWSDSMDLVYTGSWASFLFAVPLEAGLHDYAFRLYLESAGQFEQVHTVDDVACGDVYLINGQSNAVAADYHGEDLGNADQSHWIRTYGSASTEAAQVVADTGWHVADGEGANDSGTIGAWGLRAARILVDRYQIPIALINGAVGGSPLYQHKRDESHPENLGTIYGRLLFRARQAGVDQKARAILWHQGESNGLTNAHVYLPSFGELLETWLEDFPAVERVFVFQIRKGCGTPSMGIREAQRQFPDYFPEVTIMPTAGIDDHDGCHYRYAGYRQMGDWIAGRMAVFFYGEVMPDDSVPPNISEARFTGPNQDEIELLFRNPQQALILDPGIETRFRLRGNVHQSIVAATAFPGRIVLKLSGPTNAPRLAYIGQARSGPWIKNTFGVGAFTFEVPIHR